MEDSREEQNNQGREGNVRELLENAKAKENTPEQRVKEITAEYRQAMTNLYKEQRETRKMYFDKYIASLTEQYTLMKESEMKKSGNKVLLTTIYKRMDKLESFQKLVMLMNTEAKIENLLDRIAIEYNKKSWETIRQICNDMTE